MEYPEPERRDNYVPFWLVLQVIAKLEFSIMVMQHICRDSDFFWTGFNGLC